MATQYTIVKNKPKPLTQNYDQLRRLGLTYIEQLSKNLWTDYNVHDPGITTLEILCYALTDLAHRTSLPMEDLLARLDSEQKKDFFTAREILTCNPVSFDDLRKKIIDIEGVENAWVEPYTDDICATTKAHPAYHIRCNPFDKSFDIHTEPFPGFEEARNINGLYQFKLLLEEDPVLGDLNILTVDWEMRDAVGLRTALVRFIFPLNTEKTYPAQKGVLTDVDRLLKGPITDFTLSNLDTGNNTFDLSLKIGVSTVNIDDVVFHIQPVHTGDQLFELKNKMWAFISTPANKAQIIGKVFSVFAQKVGKVSGIIDDVFCMYHKIRNLCEDVVKIGIVPAQEIALCADIETDNAVDLEELLGKIYFLVDVFLSPPVRFYLLKELLDKGLPAEIIFEGPVLAHGFILDEELRKKSLFSEVHVSDLYSLIMSIEGVKSIKYLQITNYLNGLPQTDGAFWKQVLYKTTYTEYHLNLDRLRSKITFYKGDMPITADKQVANRIYQDMKATLSKPRISPDLKLLNDLLPPVGTPIKIDEFYSIQNEFPHVYGVSRDGIPDGSDATRKAQIKQFKGYLLFFDQLLSNYLSQLAEIKNLYSISNTNTKTYFEQPVYDAPYPDNTETLNFPDTAPLLTDFTIPVGADIDNPDTYKLQWKSFADNPTNNFRKKLASITEAEDETLDRRNRFLDHLLARFAESFSDYTVLMYQFTGNVLESMNKKTSAEIADDKVNFLQQYHITSYNRGKGQYYKCCPDVADCDALIIPPVDLTVDEVLEYDHYNNVRFTNVSGLQKRASLLLGMSVQDNSLLVLNKFKVLTIPPVLPATQPTYRFAVQYDATHQLRSVKEYATEKKAFAAMELLAFLATEEDKDPVTAPIYFVIVPVGTKSVINVFDFSNTLFATSDQHNTVVEATEAIKKIKEAFATENMHIIEHLLLRPLPVLQKILKEDVEVIKELNQGGFFPLCPAFDPHCDCPNKDYYSFRISAVLPYWPERFRNMDFRSFAEDTIHRETPAHILPKFCWVSMYDMNRLERAYVDWFAENKKYRPDMALLKELLKALIKVLNTLSNVYPVGHLHDCENPSTDNPVILNLTNLGTF